MAFMPPPPILIFGTCKYVILHDNRDFADMIRVKDLKTERLSWVTWVGPILPPHPWK